MWRRLSRIPTDVLRTTDGLAGRAVTWAVRAEAGSASGKDGSRGGVTESAGSNWAKARWLVWQAASTRATEMGPTGQIRQVAAHGAQERRPRARVGADSWSAVFGKSWARTTGTDSGRMSAAEDGSRQAVSGECWAQGMGCGLGCGSGGIGGSSKRGTRAGNGSGGIGNGRAADGSGVGRAKGIGNGSGGTGSGGGYRTWAGNSSWGPTEDVSGVGMASSGQRARGSGSGGLSGSDVVGRCGAWVGIGNGSSGTGGVSSSGLITGAKGGIDWAKGCGSGSIGGVDTGDGDGADGADKAGSGTQGIGTETEGKGSGRAMGLAGVIGRAQGSMESGSTGLARTWHGSGAGCKGRGCMTGAAGGIG